MYYYARLWIEDGKVLCCSGVCTEQSCPRVGICKETYIKEFEEDTAESEEDATGMENEKAVMAECWQKDSDGNSCKSLLIKREDVEVME